RGSPPPRPRHELARAVRANVLHRLRALCAKGALVRADEGHAGRLEPGAATLACAAHLQGHEATLADASRSIAASPGSPRSTLKEFTYSSMCARQTSSDSSCECARTYARLAPG